MSLPSGWFTLSSHVNLTKSLLNSGLPWWLNSKESTSNAGDQGLIPVLGRSPGDGNINNLRYADDTILMAESEELKSLLMKSERGE